MFEALQDATIISIIIIIIPALVAHHLYKTAELVAR